MILPPAPARPRIEAPGARRPAWPRRCRGVRPAAGMACWETGERRV